MLTQEQALAELRQLNQELGLAEGDGVPMTKTQAEAELRALDEELASTPESFGEYVERRKVEDSRSLGDKTSAFTDSFLTGAGALASEGSKAIGELFSGNVGKSEIGGVFKIGMADFKRFAETLGGSAMDNFYSDEEEMKREYERYKDNFLYNQNVRTAMLNTYDEEGRDFISFGANFVDPTLLIPGAGLLTKGASLGAKAVATGAKAGAFAARSPRLVQLSRAMAKTSRGAQKVAKGLDKVSDVASIPAKLAASGTRKAIKGSALVGSKIASGVGKTGELTSKVAALPRNLATKLIPKLDPKTAGAVAATAQIGAATQGMVPGLGILTSAEILGFLANKTGRGVERTLSALASTGGQKRFLQRLATSADSPRLRKLALMAHSGIGGVGATKLTDLAFNSLVNGASVGVLNGALAYASGEGAEGVGAAVGSGTLMGGSLPFGQPGMKGGKSQAARDQSSINFLNAKLADDQIKQFKKLSPEARLAFATVEEAGIRAPKLAFLDKKTYLDFLRQDDPNLRQAPNAHYDMGDNTIYVNQDGNAGRSSKEAMDILTHELGHHFITQGIKDDPLFARKILEQYEAKPGEESFEFAFTTDTAGSPIDSIQLNADAKKISDGYDSIQSGDQSISVGMDANKLAQEIGAEQFAMMMVDNPNIFNTIEPSLRQKLLDGSRKVLTMFGAVDGNTGNPLDISISPILKRNKQVRNLYKNYIKQREKSIAHKVDLAEKGVSMKVRKGESADQAVERMFGAQGISLKDAGAFRINNRKIREKLSQILNRLNEQPEGPMSSERNPTSGKPQSIVGKELSPELRNVFTRNDPRGTINVLINDITESIKNRIQLNFLYRSGKPSKYSDNELRARVVSPVRFKVTGILAKGPKSAASLKMDAIDEAYLRNNVEVLVKEGFAKDPNKLIEQAREVARQAMDDPEGRINPEGNFENELITAVFGMEQSAPQIRNARLRQLLEDKKLQHAYRSYDVDALAGIAPTGKSGIAFDYFNIKNNYSPFDDKLFHPAYHGTPHTLAPEPGAPFGKFRTSAIGTGEGAQAYGHGLYFAGKREVADHYRNALGYDPDKMKINGRQINDEYNRFAGNPKATNLDYQIAEGIERLMMNESPQDVISYFKENDFDPRSIKYFEDAKFETYGSLYKVELAPKENEYLLYDKTLGEQTKDIQNKVRKVLTELEGEDLWEYRKDLDYRDITDNALENVPEPEISKRLKEAGIPGIKYLDGSSRSKGEGDYNYVIFDEADVAITEKLFMPASEAGAGKGKQAEAADLDFKISTRNPTAKNATENPITEDLIINTASIADDVTMLESHALALQEYPGIKRNSKVPKKIIDSFVDHVVDNLLYLHDQVRPEVRDRSKLWYDGARNITEKWNQQYGNDKQSIAAALASLSPQKDWFMNVDLARRMLDIYKDQSGFAFDKAMAKKYIQLFEKGIGKKKATEIAEAMVGKTLNDLKSDYEQAAFIRSYDEVYNPREYQVVSPEGDFIGPAKSLDGANKKVAWGSMTEISKAVKVLRNPSKESISTALGNAHKIRNFYNNILLPNADKFSVTIDTHAIAAALLRPLAGADLEVANNFGSKPKGAKRSIKNSSVKGISGTYGIYADAYRKAAEARGILPREMQSITWEAIRGLYEAKWKTKSNKGKIDNLWEKYENGELTLNETRKQILEVAGGITEPEWVTERSNSRADGTNESANNSQELYRPELGGSQLRTNPRGGRTNSRGSQEVNFLPAGNFSRQPANRITRQAPAMPGNRFMAPAVSAGAKSAERFR